MNPPLDTEALSRIERRLDLLLAEVATLTARQRRLDDLLAEGVPIAREMMKVWGEKLQLLEDRGYFSLGEALLTALDRVVQGYEAEDFRLLAENAKGMVQVIRSLTQPELLAIAEDAAQVLRGAGGIEPVSVFGALHASREEEVQRGLAVTLALLRRVGTAAPGPHGGVVPSHGQVGMSRGLDARLAGRLAPTRRPLILEPAPPPPPVPKADLAPKPVASVSAATGEASPPWTPEIARLLAEAEGVDLNPEAWKVIDWARKTREKTGSSPNIRAITKGMGVDTRALYTLFPKAPGRTIARIAGIPKPAGCL